jgi:predicted DNA-binding protein
MYTEGTYLIVTSSGKFIGVYLSDDESAIAMAADIIGCAELAEAAKSVLEKEYREVSADEIDISTCYNVLTIEFLEKIKKGIHKRMVSKDYVLSGRAGIKIDISHESARRWDASLITLDGEYNQLQFYSHGRTRSICAKFSSLKQDDFYELVCDGMGLEKRMAAAEVSSEELRRGMQTLVPYFWGIVNLLIGEDRIVAFSMTPSIAERKTELSKEVDRHDVFDLKRMIEHRIEDRCSWYIDTAGMDGKRCYAKVSDTKVIYAEYHIKTNYFTQTLWPEGESLYEIIGT